jgi:acylphosphatase
MLRDMHHVHLVIRGRVQGVGFRYFALRRARDLRVSGQVWNRPDGSVEIQAEGEPDALDGFVDAVRRGPSGARVERVEETRSEGPARHRDFVIAAGEPA